MKQVVVSGVVAAVVSFLVLEIGERTRDEPIDEDVLAEHLAAHPLIAERLDGPSLTYTDELIQDGWVNGARAPGAEHKPLAPAESSICYLTKVQIKGIQGPEDSSSCSIGIDDFTGYWQVTAAVEEGSRSEVRCNARCLVWE
ncbi:MAG TPA: hypothetical protein VF329_15395 [Gammaproteobacteria bacterium]